MYVVAFAIRLSQISSFFSFTSYTHVFTMILHVPYLCRRKLGLKGEQCLCMSTRMWTSVLPKLDAYCRCADSEWGGGGGTGGPDPIEICQRSGLVWMERESKGCSIYYHNFCLACFARQYKAYSKCFENSNHFQVQRAWHDIPSLRSS